LEVDLEDPETYIARAVAARHAGASDQAIADLEMAIGHVHNLRPDLYSRLAWEYAQSIPKGDPRIKRVGALLLRAATSMLKACSVGTKPTTGGE
jgi:hypothetical protein